MSNRFSSASASLLAVVCMSMVSWPASAQDNYQRGYDQGFRDGVNSVRPGPGDGGGRRGGRGGGIEIESAWYGARGRSCDLRDSMRLRARGTSSMTVPVDNRLCGDPAPGRKKQLVVTYRCYGGAIIENAAEESRIMRIDCN
jgi:hypothetical protein